jgi:hypothetical protein
VVYGYLLEELGQNTTSAERSKMKKPHIAFGSRITNKPILDNHE